MLLALATIAMLALALGLVGAFSGAFVNGTLKLTPKSHSRSTPLYDLSRRSTARA
jgi:hypothetical protein